MYAEHSNKDEHEINRHVIRKMRRIPPLRLSALLVMCMASPSATWWWTSASVWCLGMEIASMASPTTDAGSVMLGNCEIHCSLLASQQVLVDETTETNSQGTWLSVKLVNLGCWAMHWASCDPRTGMLSPSAGLWYPGGEMMHRLTIGRMCDSIHMLSRMWFQVAFLFTMPCYVQFNKQE